MSKKTSYFLTLAILALATSVGAGPSAADETATKSSYRCSHESGASQLFVVQSLDGADLVTTMSWPADEPISDFATEPGTEGPITDCIRKNCNDKTGVAEMTCAIKCIKANIPKPTSPEPGSALATP